MAPKVCLVNLYRFRWLFFTNICIYYGVAVAAVLSNWHSVLRAINMASSKNITLQHMNDRWLMTPLVKLPKSKAEEDDKDVQDTSSVPLPQTLVRIPVATSQQTGTQANPGKGD